MEDCFNIKLEFNFRKERQETARWKYVLIVLFGIFITGELNSQTKLAKNDSLSAAWLKNGNLVDISMIEPNQFIDFLKVKERRPEHNYVVITVNKASENWSSKENLKYFYSILKSKDDSKCIVQSIGSYLPKGHSTIGDQVAKILECFMSGEQYPNFLYSCKEADKTKLKEIEHWLKRKIK